MCLLPRATLHSDSEQESYQSNTCPQIQRVPRRSWCRQTSLPIPCLLVSCSGVPWYSMGPNKSTATDWKIAPSSTLWSERGPILCSMHLFSFSLHSVQWNLTDSASAHPLVTHTFRLDLCRVETALRALLHEQPVRRSCSICDPWPSLAALPARRRP